MLIAEAQWIGRFLSDLTDSAFPLANVGCQTEQFERDVQPWIRDHVFGPVRSRGLPIVNIDIRDDPNVDVVADVTTEAGREAIRASGAQTLLCANVLEHVAEPQVLLNALLAAVPPGGHLIVTGPLAFPYHPDPIDTMFRPTCHEIAASVGEGFKVEAAENITCRRLIVYTMKSRQDRWRTVARMAFPFLKPSGWLSRMKWLATPTSCYVVAIRRLPSSAVLGTLL